jgi:OmpA-OmpF porin, OOP family
MFVSKTPWIILLVVWMAGSTWWHVCNIKQLCANDAEPAVAVTSPDDAAVPDDVPVVPAVTPSGLTIADGDRFRLVVPGNFSFARSGANANMNALGNSLDSLTAYLKGSGPSSGPGRTMTITGYYTTDETNGTTFANLGLARAEGVKQYLVQQGIPVASLMTKGEVRSAKDASSGLAFTPKGDSLYGGLGFSFGGAEPAAGPTADSTATVAAPLPATEEGLAAAEKYTSVFEPIDLYFPLGTANYIKTPETAKFFAEAAKYLAAHKDKKLQLTGHTDNSGPDATNLRLTT